MKWRETNTVRDFRTFRNMTYVITTFHGLHDELYNVVIEGENTVTAHRMMTKGAIQDQYGIEL